MKKQQIITHQKLNALPRSYIISGYDICNTNRCTLILNHSPAMQLSQMCHGVSCSAIYLATSQCLRRSIHSILRCTGKCNRRLQKQRLLPIGRSKRLRGAISLLHLTEQNCVCGLSHRESGVGKRNLTSNVYKDITVNGAIRSHVQHD